MTRLTLRGACWLHYWERGNVAAARAVSQTGLTLAMAERIADQFGILPLSGADAKRAA